MVTKSGTLSRAAQRRLAYLRGYRAKTDYEAQARATRKKFGTGSQVTAQDIKKAREEIDREQASGSGQKQKTYIGITGVETKEGKIPEEKQVTHIYERSVSGSYRKVGTVSTSKIKEEKRKEKELKNSIIKEVRTEVTPNKITRTYITDKGKRITFTEKTKEGYIYDISDIEKNAKNKGLDVKKGDNKIIITETPTYIVKQNGIELPISPGVAGKLEEAREEQRKKIEEYKRLGYKEISLDKALELGIITNKEKEQYKKDKINTLFVSQETIALATRNKKIKKETENIYKNLTPTEKVLWDIKSFSGSPLGYIINIASGKSPEEIRKYSIEKEVATQIKKQEPTPLEQRGMEVGKETWKRLSTAEKVTSSLSLGFMHPEKYIVGGTKKLLKGDISGAIKEPLGIGDVSEKIWTEEVEKKYLRNQYNIQKSNIEKLTEILNTTPVRLAMGLTLGSTTGSMATKLLSVGGTGGTILRTGFTIGGGALATQYAGQVGSEIGAKVGRKEYPEAIEQSLVVAGESLAFFSALKSTMKKPKVKKEFLDHLERVSHKKTDYVVLRRRGDVDKIVSLLKSKGIKYKVTVHDDYWTVKWQKGITLDVITKDEIMKALKNGVVISDDTYTKVIEYKGTRYYLNKYPSGKKVTKLKDIVTVLKGTTEHVGKFKGMDVYMERTVNIPVEIGKPSEFDSSFKPFFKEASTKGYSYDPVRNVYFIKKPFSKDYYVIKSEALKNPAFWKNLPSKFRSFLKSRKGTVSVTSRKSETLLDESITDINKIIKASPVSLEVTTTQGSKIIPSLIFPSFPKKELEIGKEIKYPTYPKGTLLDISLRPSQLKITETIPKLYVPSVELTTPKIDTRQIESFKALEKTRPSYKITSFSSMIESEINKTLPPAIPPMPRLSFYMGKGSSVDTSLRIINRQLLPASYLLSGQPSINIGHVGRISSPFNLVNKLTFERQKRIKIGSEYGKKIKRIRFKKPKKVKRTPLMIPKVPSLNEVLGVKRKTPKKKLKRKKPKIRRKEVSRVIGFARPTRLMPKIPDVLLPKALKIEKNINKLLDIQKNIDKNIDKQINEIEKRLVF